MYDTVKEDVKYAIEDLIDMICNKGTEDSSDSMSHRLFYQVFKGAVIDIDHIIHDIRRQLEDNMDTYKEEIASELSEKFSKRFWYKFEDGHTVDPGVKMICYFQKDHSYRIGTSIEKENQISFLFEDGSISDPDFVACLPLMRATEPTT